MIVIIFTSLTILLLFAILFMVTFVFNIGTRLKTRILLPFKDRTYYSTEYVYIVTIITGQRPCAGSEADIYIKLHGECLSTDLFKLNDLSKGTFQRGAIDRFLIFTKESLGHIVRIELQIDAHGSQCQDWLLTEINVQDPQNGYRPYIFPCCQWFKAGGCTYKHFIVGPRDFRASYLRTFIMSASRGLPQYHLWLAAFFDNRRARRFNGCTASILLFQLSANLLLLNLVPVVIPHHVTHDDLLFYSLPFNLVCFVITAILEVLTRNIRPRSACLCPFHHDWNEEMVAYRNSVILNISKKPLNLDRNPTYESLLKCLTDADWRQARGIARDVWSKCRKDTITDEVLDDIIKAFLYRSAQKIQRGAAWDSQVRECRKDRSNDDMENSSCSSQSGSYIKLNKNQSAINGPYHDRMRLIISNMESEFTNMLMNLGQGHQSNECDPYMITANRTAKQSLFPPNYHTAVTGGYNVEAKKSCDPMGSDMEDCPLDDYDEAAQLLNNNANANTSQNANANANGCKTDRYELDSDDKDTIVIYSIKEGEKLPGESTKVHKSRTLFMSDIEFVIKSPNKDSLACVRLHNSLSKACAYEVRANNPSVYDIQPNIGLIQAGSTVDINIWLLQASVVPGCLGTGKFKGYDVKILDSILVTVRPVDAYYSDPNQIRWLWKTASKNTILQYALHCKGIIPKKIREPLDLTTEHLIQLELEANGEHTKHFVPWTLYPIYVFCAIQGAISLLLVVHYGFEMGDIETQEWMELFGIALLQHIFVFEVVKLLMLSICAALLRKNWLIFT